MTKHDEKIKQLLSKVDSEKKKLGTKPKISWNTNCLFRYDDNRHFNLNTVKDTNVLVEALAFLLEKQAMQTEAAKRLGVGCSDFEWRGFSAKDWEEDFRLKAELIAWNVQKNKLADLQKQLKGLVSEEAKTEMALADIEKMLK